MCKIYRFRFIPCMSKVLLGHILSIDTFYSVQWFCYRTAKALIWTWGCAGRSGPLLSAYARRHNFTWLGQYHISLMLISEPVCSSEYIRYPNYCAFKNAMCVIDDVETVILSSMAPCEDGSGGMLSLRWVPTLNIYLFVTKLAYQELWFGLVHVFLVNICILDVDSNLQRMFIVYAIPNGGFIRSETLQLLLTKSKNENETVLFSWIFFFTLTGKKTWYF